MPYIIKKHKSQLFDAIAGLKFSIDDAGKSEGVLNYVITKLLIHYFDGIKSYRKYNAAIGVLECAKMELYRRLVSEYEDAKIAENGDVYEEL